MKRLRDRLAQRRKHLAEVVWGWAKLPQRACSLASAALVVWVIYLVWRVLRHPVRD